MRSGTLVQGGFRNKAYLHKQATVQMFARAEGILRVSKFGFNVTYIYMHMESMYMLNYHIS